MQGLNEALLSSSNSTQVQSKPVKTEQNEGDDSFYKMIENSVKEYEDSKASQNSQENNQSKPQEQITNQTTQGSSTNSSDKTAQSSSQTNSAKTDSSQSDKMIQNSASNSAQSSQNTDEIMLENADFITLLSLLEASDGSTKTGANLLSSSLNKFLATEQNIKELKGAKNLQELLNLSEKFGLGLSKIKISKDGLEALKNEFKNLNAKGFFNQIPALNQAIDLNAITKKDIEKALQKTQKDDKSVLSKLMQGQSVELSDDINSVKKLHPEAKIDTQKITEKLAQTAEQKLNQPSELNKEIKDTKTTTTTTPNATKSQSISSIDDYLANIMQRAMKESSEQSAKAAMTATTDLASSSVEASLSEQTTQGIEPTSQANSQVKDIVNSAKLNAKELNLRQVFDNFATQLQEKISEYKPPITRFHLTLNPGNLGEVEITLINRGSNLHINFNSNNQTMQLFMQHQAEFRTSLVNMGFSELSMSFNDNANKEQSQGQNKKAKFVSEDSELTEIAQNEESVLEVILPKYF
ncbi:MAG: flagellar hook-length control protein FliK [Campylobacter sp.]|uniref:flagellar hook-length control protein FliK n=1 Tax=Campylobacter sp. TaxID=205 RepID=UPI001B1AF3D9|nr:flagellar hook-length control protein FliK [Campylobacter sp.]MBO7155163.1 flagellar hook-length control protein FliK [Campylobacter sp.]